MQQTEPQRLPPPRAGRAWWLAWGACLGVACIGLPNFWGKWDSAVTGAVEAPLLILSIGLAVLGTLRALTGSETRLPGGLVSAQPPLRVALVLIALVVVGQLAKSKKTYPFMPLRMYGAEATGPIELLLYEATRYDGQVERFRPSLVIAELGAARIVRGLQKKLSGLPSTGERVEDSTLTQPQQKGIDMLRKLARKHNQTQVSLGQASRQVRDVYIYRVHRSPPYTAASETRTLLARVSLEPQGSKEP